jgi:hypothetical protein
MSLKTLAEGIQGNSMPQTKNSPPAVVYAMNPSELLLKIFEIEDQALHDIDNYARSVQRECPHDCVVSGADVVAAMERPRTYIRMASKAINEVWEIVTPIIRERDWVIQDSTTSKYHYEVHDKDGYVLSSSLSPLRAFVQAYVKTAPAYDPEPRRWGMGE